MYSSRHGYPNYLISTRTQVLFTTRLPDSVALSELCAILNSISHISCGLVVFYNNQITKLCICDRRVQCES